MIDTAVLLVVLICGVVGLVAYYILRLTVAIVWLFARSISYTRWSIAVISTEGRKKWEAKTWYQRWWEVITYIFSNLLISGRITCGDNYWDGIFDHKP